MCMNTCFCVYVSESVSCIIFLCFYWCTSMFSPFLFPTGKLHPEGRIERLSRKHIHSFSDVQVSLLCTPKHVRCA